MKGDAMIRTILLSVALCAVASSAMADGCYRTSGETGDNPFHARTIWPIPCPADSVVDPKGNRAEAKAKKWFLVIYKATVEVGEGEAVVYSQDFKSETECKANMPKLIDDAASVAMLFGDFPGHYVCAPMIAPP
jgi:hypothetical protein